MAGGSDAWGEHRAGFRWNVPHEFNMAASICRWADGSGRPALIFVDEEGGVERHSFDMLDQASNRFANALSAAGLRTGDRLAVLLSQCPEVAVAHLAGFKAGLITVPLFTLFGEDALEFRLADSAARAVITDMAGAAKIMALRDRLPALDLVYVTGAVMAPRGCLSLDEVLAAASDRFACRPTMADDPAIIIYTSGTTGNPKGALHAHRVLLGHLPGVELPHSFFPQPGDLMWTPADWAWIGGLFDVLLPALYHGVPVLAFRARKFDPDQAYGLMARHKVRNVFLPATALKMFRQAGPPPPDLALRTVASGGETLGTELLDWSMRRLGIALHEFYGQTECNLVAGNCSALFPIRPGSLGRALPGHDVRIVDADGAELPRGETGIVGIRRPDPVMFLGYWRNPAASAAKFAGDMLLTGDMARQDEDGYFWFVGRSDDIITSGGYRIGPGEIEDCLLRHPAVAMAGVAGIPDALRTEIVKAWLVLRPGFAPSDTLVRELQEHVRARLAAHEFPRAIAFVDELPMTATGKIIRRELRARG